MEERARPLDLVLDHEEQAAAEFELAEGFGGGGFRGRRGGGRGDGCGWRGLDRRGARGRCRGGGGSGEVRSHRAERFPGPGHGPLGGADQPDGRSQQRPRKAGGAPGSCHAGRPGEPTGEQKPAAVAPPAGLVHDGDPATLQQESAGNAEVLQTQDWQGGSEVRGNDEAGYLAGFASPGRPQVFRLHLAAFGMPLDHQSPVRPRHRAGSEVLCLRFEIEQ
ncbi:MAG: hypothetical protein B9S38_08170 [Verrucomicrobiia bacterium Tous-C4TDCM]|nr:MAG: hypothetical protein B9S38_08170 [Verrucomicrobiae bacterium Tous-C4TDCM]